MARRLLTAAILCAALLVSRSAIAYDPALEWYTVVTPHFRLHYPKGYYAQALEAARDAETAFAKHVAFFEWQPKTPIDIVLDDETDAANGFSRAYPYNLVGLNAVAPDDVSELSDYDDWLNVLLSHELTHDVHIDQVHGLPWLVNSVFGRVLVPNSAQPSWFTEGMAVQMETRLTSRGRLRSSYFEMLERMQLLTGRQLTLDEITGGPLRWPQGEAAYIYGAHFLDWIRVHYGENTLRDIGHVYGSQLIPYAMNVASQQVVGRQYAELYDDFMKDEIARFTAQKVAIETAGRIEGEKLTDRGQDIGGQRVLSDGSVVFVETPIGAQSQLRIREPSGRERYIRRLTGSADIAVLPGEHEVILVQYEVTDLYYVFGDLFRVNLDDGGITRLTTGTRANGISVTGDGAYGVFAANDGGHSTIKMIRFADKAIWQLVDLGPVSNAYSPQFSPDGKHVVFSGFKSGQRDLYVVDVAGHDLHQVTDDRAIDSGAVYSPDGKWIYFHSDRSGVFDVYAMAVRTGETRRVTRVLGGAFEPRPSPDGHAIVYRTYGPEGFDLARLPLGDLDESPIAEADSVVRPAPPPHARLEAYPSTPYNPTHSVYPRAWMPIASQDPRGNTYGVEVTGQDALGRHTFDVQYLYGTSSQFNSFNAVYQNLTFRPGFTLSAQRVLSYASVPVLTVNGRNQYVEEEQWNGGLQTTVFLYRTFFRTLTLTPSYNIRYRKPFELDTSQLDPSAVPEYGWFNSTSLTLSFSNTQSYLGSISPQDGVVVSLGGRLEEPWLGSQYSSKLGTFDINGYITNPFFRRHVIAAELYGAYGVSSYNTRRLFSIAGLPSRNIVLDALSGRLSGAQALRGFPLTPFSGNCLVEGHLEYRFPLYDLFRGIDTLPIFFRQIHAAPFLDAAAIADQPKGLVNGEHYSVGGELRLNVIIAYSIASTLRIGYGHGLGKDSNTDGFFVLLSSSY